MKIVKQFQLKIVIFTAVKNRFILHGRIFVMSGVYLPIDGSRGTQDIDMWPPLYNVQHRLDGCSS